MLVMGNYSAIVPCGHLSFKPCNARLFSISIALGARIRANSLDKKSVSAILSPEKRKPEVKGKTKTKGVKVG